MQLGILGLDPPQALSPGRQPCPRSQWSAYNQESICRWFSQAATLISELASIRQRGSCAGRHRRHPVGRHFCVPCNGPSQPARTSPSRSTRRLSVAAAGSAQGGAGGRGRGGRRASSPVCSRHPGRCPGWSAQACPHGQSRAGCHACSSLQRLAGKAERHLGRPRMALVQRGTLQLPAGGPWPNFLRNERWCMCLQAPLLAPNTPAARRTSPNASS